MGKAQFLAQQVSDLSFEGLPDEVVFKAKTLLLDQIGCQLAFATLPWSKAALSYAQTKRGQGKSTVVYHGVKMNAEDAAMCNAVFGHGFEMDDTDMDTTSHPAVCVIPATLALAEQEGASGKDVLTAMVAGYEVMLRVARAADSMRLKFFHASSVPGAFGVAAAVGKMLRFDESVIGHALGIATSMAAGNTEYTQSGGTVKRTLGATGVAAGMRAALLAQAGITGPAEAFEGRKSYLRGICPDEPVWEELDRAFGQGEWLMMGVGTKPYCCCAGQHAVIDAAELIRQEGVRAEDIERAVIIQRPRECSDVGVITIPDDVISAQFCGRFALALRFVKGSNGYYDYVQENVDDPAIRKLVARVDYEVDKDCVRLTTPEGPAIVRVALKDGRTIEKQVDYAVGRKQNPMPYDDVVTKFKGLAGGAMPEETVEGIIDAVMHIEEAETTEGLMKLLVK